MEIADLGILIIEDETFQQRLVEMMLNNMGIKRIFLAGEGQSALAQLASEHEDIDLIICDLKMPGMDGLEFMRYLSELHYRKPLIIASALEHSLIASIEMMAEAYGITVLGIIEKPLTKSKLYLLLNKLLVLNSSVAEIPDQPRSQQLSYKELERALVHNEFEAFYQPKVLMKTGRLKGAEALSRWHHPQRGMIPPTEFIPQLENYGLIDTLTMKMLEQAASSCRLWHESNLRISVSVNLSLQSLINPLFADQITRLVKEQGLEPNAMILEITESATTTQVAAALENLARLRMNGFGLSIDDFGTGYSSIQQLMRIPYTEMKIDQSFVTNVTQKESTRVILASSLEMARKLKISTVAEGVETMEDWNYLLELGCDIVQGFLIAKPLPPEEFLDWNDEWLKKGILSVKPHSD